MSCGCSKGRPHSWLARRVEAAFAPSGFVGQVVDDTTSDNGESFCCLDPSPDEDPFDGDLDAFPGQVTTWDPPSSSPEDPGEPDDPDDPDDPEEEPSSDPSDPDTAPTGGTGGYGWPGWEQSYYDPRFMDAMTALGMVVVDTASETTTEEEEEVEITTDTKDAIIIRLAPP